MKQTYLIRKGNPRLLIFFAGWASDDTPFRAYHPRGMDYMVAYDYRSLHFDASVLDAYRSVNIVAWSMGVWVAGMVLARLGEDRVGKVETSIAMGGTQRPIDDDEGIPTAVFDATLNGLTQASLQKFNRRMCGNQPAYEAYLSIAPRRAFEDVAQELRLIRQHYLSQANVPTHWAFHQAYVGIRDRIFPPENMTRHFAHLHCPDVRSVDVAHYDERLFRYLLHDRWNTTH